MMSKKFIQTSTFSSWLLALGLLLAGIGGAFGPWVNHNSVALQLTAPGLAEFVKFLPEIRLGQLNIERLYFLLPLFVAMLTIPLIAANQKLALPAWLRWLLRLAVIPLALASLSPVWTPVILATPEFRLQTILAGLAIALALISPLFKTLPLKPLALILIITGLAATSLPWQQFNLIRPALEDVYREPIRLGWGWGLMVAGFVAGVTGGLIAAYFSQPPQQDEP